MARASRSPRSSREAAGEGSRPPRSLPQPKSEQPLSFLPEKRRLGIGPEFFEDVINLVLCCSGCNGFGNRYRSSIGAQEHWTLDEFLTLRNAIFEERFRQIAARRAAEIAKFESRPWALSGLNSPLPLSAGGSHQSGYMEGSQPVRTFVDDDSGYLAWVDTNQDGFVVNSFRYPKADYLILHRATCKSVSRSAPEPIRWTTGGYSKTCSVSHEELEGWAREATGGTLTHCGMCHPV